MRLSTTILPFVLAMSLVGGAQAQTFDGDWKGALQIGDRTLRAEVHIKTVDGKISTVLDSIDQGQSIEASATQIQDGELQALFLAIGGELRMKPGPDGDTLVGSWVQGPPLPLTLTRMSLGKP